MRAACSQCVRIRLAVPEAVHQLRQMPGLEVLSSQGTLVDGVADPAVLDRLRESRLVKRIEVSPAKPPLAAEPMEPLLASLLHGIVAMLQEPTVKLILGALLLRLVVRRAP